jgi:G:T-mismatch repair DNA endonuclease (very short patch repair protein)
VASEVVRLLACIMGDVFTPEERSKVMSHIQGRDTKPELALRSMHHRLGYRITINGTKLHHSPGNRISSSRNTAPSSSSTAGLELT